MSPDTPSSLTNQNSNPSYRPPEIYSRLDPLLGSDVIIACRDGFVLFHSCVLMRSSKRMRDLLANKCTQMAPHKFDLRRHYQVHGKIVRRLLYEGVMDESLDPTKSHLTVVERIQLLKKSHEIVRNLGLDCILRTIESWIRILGGDPQSPDDNDVKSGIIASHSMENITSSSDSVAFLPSPARNDEDTDEKASTVSPTADSATEDSEPMNCGSDEPASSVPFGGMKYEIQTSDDSQGSSPDASPDSPNFCEPPVYPVKIKKEPVEVDDCIIGSQRTATPVRMNE